MSYFLWNYTLSLGVGPLTREAEREQKSSAKMKNGVKGGNEKKKRKDEQCSWVWELFCLFPTKSPAITFYSAE